MESFQKREKLHLAELERFQRDKDQHQEDSSQERRQSEYRRSRLVEKLTLATRRADEAGKAAEELESRNRRLLLDLEAIASGQPPLQARQSIDAGVLSGLADEAQDTAPVEVEPAEKRTTHANFLTLVIVLAAALALSILINLVLLLN